MFGSIVIVLPTEFKGGELALCHGEKEFMYDYTAMGRKGFTEDGGSGRVGWVAFYSDIEHEVLPVTEGYRVTLTYVRLFLLLHNHHILTRTL